MRSLAYRQLLHPGKGTHAESKAALQRARALCASARAADSKRALVICIGWLGAQQRYLDKYVDVWEQRGHDTLAIRPRTSSIVIPPLGDRQVAGALADIRAVQGAHPGRRTIYHIFSNAGFIFFGTMLRSLAAPALRSSAAPRVSISEASKGANRAAETKHLGVILPHNKECGALSVLDPVDGLILDSAPSRLTPDIAARGFVSAALAEPAAGIEGARPRLVGAARAVLRPVLELRYIAGRVREVWQAWETVAPRARQLYLYSDTDALIPPSEVHRFMALQEARGVEVSSRMFAGSAHVAHFRQYPEEYVAELDRFMGIMPQAAPAA